MRNRTNFRRATDVDVLEILNIQRLAFLNLTAGFYSSSVMSEALREVPLFDVSLIAEGHYFVLEDQAQTILAAGGWSRERPSYQGAVSGLTTPGAGTATVRSVLVHPDHARQGNGRAMMAHIEGDARAGGITRLTMTATLSGLPLYRAIGYRPTDWQAAQLPSGAVVELRGMEKSIAGPRNRAA